LWTGPLANCKDKAKNQTRKQNFRRKLEEKTKKIREKRVPGANMRRIKFGEEKRHFIKHAVGTTISADSYMCCKE
jgi:hypothetical protein